MVFHVITEFKLKFVLTKRLGALQRSGQWCCPQSVPSYLSLVLLHVHLLLVHHLLSGHRPIHHVLPVHIQVAHVIHRN